MVNLTNKTAKYSSISLLVSTMDYKFIDRLVANPSLIDQRFHVVVVNQTANFDETKEREAGKFNMLRLETIQTLGLSSSRNLAVSLCETDLAVICDDDLDFTNGLYEKLLSVHNSNSDTIITTKIRTPAGSGYKVYSKHPHKHSKATLVKVSSVEISFKVAELKKVGLKFDENFGLGTDCPSGEENIFLFDALHAGLTARFIPEFTVIHQPESSNSVLTPDKMPFKKKLFERLFPYTHLMVKSLFYLRKLDHFKGFKAKMQALVRLYI